MIEVFHCHHAMNLLSIAKCFDALKTVYKIVYTTSSHRNLLVMMNRAFAHVALVARTQNRPALICHLKEAQ